ncbi:MAG: Peptidase M20 [Candidatus Woesebacteria bacterium GW2011_GWA2_40_7]|uniref:Peptidase M20 n=3 Tax=Candidatus Woeseibacteriota TaxID=1752722 RepID=A0A0G0UVC0_9BACT|nr:MAG: Peptidase M20 [Candidatus Woesebacteria bacterium GW2011_GWB1_39_10]KKR73629.1 MAG: Peptidase M20 [Candidatus Woesebacteria bacterium GW2011_GWA2_40_7]KKR92613.1 MAG: Peptidase M20 [Candidatus Woesebacteria bacterium GW2011_GWA1_41_13b]
MERKYFKEKLTELVAIPTIREKEMLKESSEALDLIESWADSALSKRRIKNGKTEILLLGNGNLLNPDIGYLAHVDVVDADKEMFKMTETDGKFYGRGVSDMKFSIPIGIEILNKLAKDKGAPVMTLAITTDEEVGGGDGGNYLANEIKFIPEVLIVPDGGDDFVFVNKSKGKATHASTPWLGKNALTPLIKIASGLGAIYDQNSASPNWETTMNLGVLQGGKSTNQVCDEATLKLDFRFPETRSANEILEEVRKASEKIDPNLSIKLGAQGDPIYTDIKNLEVTRFLKIARDVLGRNIKIEGENGASDARYWAKYNIPIIMKPNGGGIHSDKEWIDVESCLTYYEILSKYVNEFTSII